MYAGFTSMIFNHLTKRNNFHDFLIASPTGANSFLSELIPDEKGGKIKKKNRVASLESIPIHLNTVSIETNGKIFKVHGVYNYVLFYLFIYLFAVIYFFICRQFYEAKATFVISVGCPGRRYPIQNGVNSYKGRISSKRSKIFFKP